MQLTPQQRATIFAALADSYDLDDLRRMLALKLGKKLEDYASNRADRLDSLTAVMDAAEREGWLRELLTAAAAFRPQREDLARLLADLPPDAPSAPTRSIPGPELDFTGRRAELTAILTWLAPDSGKPPVAVLCGIGGVGKTQLARAAAQKLCPHYGEQAAFELGYGKSPLGAADVLAQVIHAFDPLRKLPEAVEERQTIYRELLKGQRGLLLLDNADKVAQVRPLLPPPAGWAILVTARNRLALPGGKLIDVDALTPADAAALLARILSDGGRDDVAGAAGTLGPLAEKCARLPLALRLAASFLVTTGRSLASYFRDLERERLKRLADDERSVAAVLNLSVGELTRQSAALARRWGDLAVFPAPFDAAAAAAVWGVAEGAAQDDLDNLRRQSLVEVKDGQYRLHDLLRELALQEPPGEEVYYRHADYYLAVGRAADDLYKSQALAGLQAFDPALPHLLAASEWLVRQGGGVGRGNGSVAGLEGEMGA